MFIDVVSVKLPKASATSYFRIIGRAPVGYIQQKLLARRLKVRLGNSENHRLFDPEQRLEADLGTNAYLTVSESSEVFLQNKHSLGEYCRREWNIPGTKLASRLAYGGEARIRSTLVDPPLLGPETLSVPSSPSHERLEAILGV